MADEAKPTPTPWDYDGAEISGPFDEQRQTIDTVVGQEPGSGYESYGPLILSSANGEFICRAVNAHAVLVSALSHVRYCRECGESDMEKCFEGKQLLEQLKVAGVAP